MILKDQMHSDSNFSSLCIRILYTISLCASFVPNVIATKKYIWASWVLEHPSQSQKWLRNGKLWHYFLWPQKYACVVTVTFTFQPYCFLYVFLSGGKIQFKACILPTDFLYFFHRSSSGSRIFVIQIRNLLPQCRKNIEIEIDTYVLW